MRPFAFDQLELRSSGLDPRNSHQLEDFLIQKINKMLDGLDLASKLPEIKLPLLRLRVEHSGFPVLKSKRLVDHFLNRIANISDFLQFYKKSGVQGHAQQPAQSGQPESAGQILGQGLVGMDELENQLLLSQIYKQRMGEFCTINFVSASKMAAMVENYVNQNDSHALELFFDHEVFKAAYNEVKKTMLELA